MSFRLRPRRPVVVEITALVDVVFMLVIFFTITATFTSQSGLRVELPTAKNAASEAKDESLEVAIDETGHFFLQQQPVARDKLEEQLRQASLGGERVLVIKADRNAKHGDLVFLLDRAREAGLARLAIAAEPESGQYR